MSNQKTIWQFTRLAAFAAIIPQPIIALAIIATVQFLMLRTLCKVQPVSTFCCHPFTKVFLSIISSFGTGLALTGIVSSGLEIIPFIGFLGGTVALPLVAGVSTYLLGRLAEAKPHGNTRNS